MCLQGHRARTNVLPGKEDIFDATLSPTTSIIRGEAEEELAQSLAKTGELASAGNMYVSLRYLGNMMYNSAELLFACKIAH